MTKKPPVIVWNHRWEHDKNPELFFKTLFRLASENVDFRLVVLGESFRDQPAIFGKARHLLANQIIHFGYVEQKSRYFELLKQGDIAPSTADHEFFGMAVLEAVRAGCRPLLPNRLSYKELFDPLYLYEDDEFYAALKSLLLCPDACQPLPRDSTERFSWQRLRYSYRDTFLSLAALQT